MFLFAQENPHDISSLVGYYVGQFIGILLIAAIVSGIFHLVSKFGNNKSLTFSKVFPFAFGVILVVVVINKLRLVLGI